MRGLLRILGKIWRGLAARGVLLGEGGRRLRGDTTGTRIMNNLKALAIATTALLAGTSSVAFAAGTAAGSTITNNVTVNYSVGGVAQTAVTASNNFTVDRRITLTITEPGNATTQVAPGQSGAVTTFLVTNTSNAALDLGLSIAQPAGGTAPHTGTDNFDVTGGAFYLDNAVTGTVGSYDAGDTLVTWLDEVPADGARTVFYVANVPVGQANGSIAVVTLTAQAREAGAAATQGAVVTETTGANTAGVDTVFADTAGATDATRDGLFSARDDYTVAAALLTMAKNSRVISDPLNTSTNPKMIPGAVVEYCISVANGAGGAVATGVGVSDPIPANTTYNSAFGIFVDATVTGGVCSGGTAGGSFASNTVSGTLTNIPANTTRGLYFRVTIN
jgi:uncharacterized repeat protein (TIGR01451 family)